MVKAWKPVGVLLLTFVAAVSLKNEFFLFLLGFEVMIYAASVLQVVLLSKKVSMRIRTRGRSAFRGETFQISVELTNGSRLPIPRLMARVAVKVWPERESLLLRGKLMLGGRETGSLCFDMDGSHCACLEIRPNQLMITDYLGIIQRKCRIDSSEMHLFFVLPEPESKDPEAPAGQGALTGEEGDEDRRGRTAADVADIRPYRDGDSIKLIHWKLSARLNEILVREMNDPTDPMVRILLNLQEKDEKTDTRLDRPAWDRFMETVGGVSRLLLTTDKKHTVTWADPERNVPVVHTVTDEESRQTMLCELLRAGTYYGKNYDYLIREGAADEEGSAVLEIDLQGRIDRSATA